MSDVAEMGRTLTLKRGLKSGQKIFAKAPKCYPHEKLLPFGKVVVRRARFQTSLSNRVTDFARPIPGFREDTNTMDWSHNIRNRKIIIS